jgi:hypothetical protein
MDAHGSLEEIAEQASFRVNVDAKKKNARGRGFGWGISPNIARASAAHGKKKTPKTPKPVAAKPPPILMVAHSREHFYRVPFTPLRKIVVPVTT